MQQNGKYTFFINMVHFSAKVRLVARMWYTGAGI